MKMRKEILIFGGIVLLLVIVLIVSAVRPKSQYQGGDVQISFDAEPDAQPSTTHQTPIRDDFQVGNDFPARQENAEPSSGVVDNTQVATPPSEQPGETGEQEPVSDDGETPEENLEVTGNPEDGQGDGQDMEIGNEQLAYMLAYYVCNLSHDLFDSYLSQTLKDDFGSLSGEPYESLRSNTYFENLEFDGKTLSFIDSDGITYKFNVSFEGSVVTGIEPIS